MHVDFKLSEIYWAALSYNSVLGSLDADLLGLTLKVMLHQYVDPSTRHMRKKQPSILAVVFSNLREVVNSITSASDYVCLSFEGSIIRPYQAANV